MKQPESKSSSVAFITIIVAAVVVVSGGVWLLAGRSSTAAVDHVELPPGVHVGAPAAKPTDR